MNYFTKNSNEIYEIMRKYGKKYFNLYTTNENGFFSKLNEKIRNNSPLSKLETKTVIAIKSAIFYCKTKKKLRIYKGLKSNSKQIFDNFNKIDKPKTFKGVVSTSKEYAIAKKYSEGKKYQVILELNIPAYFNCFPIFKFSKHPEEAEILLYNFEYIVTSFVLKGNVLKAKLDILPKKRK